MHPAPPPRTCSPRRERARLRSAVLSLGAFLGWQPHEVISFTKALTGRAWQRCGRAELEMVLEEYQTLIQVIDAKAARTVRADWHPPRGLEKSCVRTRLAPLRKGERHALHT